MNKLFSTLKVRDQVFKNRIAVSPMCQYSSIDGMPSDWHLVHLGSRAVGGAGLVIAEATAVSPEGRITPDDAGIWNEEQADAYKRITSFIKSQNSVPGIQIAHAGRKASTFSPWKGAGAVPEQSGGWKTLGPSPIPFSNAYGMPMEMSKDDIHKVVGQFKSAAVRAVNAGFGVIEIHMAHGYLIHEFLSPLSNKRKDNYGGSLENRCRLAVEVATAVREVIPEGLPLFARLSVTDWIEDGWDAEQSVYLSKKLKETGVDLIDCSSGGNVADAAVPLGPSYQVEFAERIRKETGINTGAVGLITSPEQAENILRTGQADIVIMGREVLRNPYWPLYAARKLKAEIDWPKQYLRAKL